MGEGWKRLRGVDGRFCSARPVVLNEQTGEVVKRRGEGAAPRPRMCRTYVQRRLAGVLPEVISALLALVREGNMQAMKVLWMMAGLDRAERGAKRGDNVRKKEKRAGDGKNSVAALLLEKLRERERAAAERAAG